MRSIVLVGGEGTRLRPLTWRTPKPLVPVLNRPLITHLLSHLRHHGIEAVTLAMTRRSELIEQALGDGSDFGVELDYVYEETPLGSGGAIAAAAAGWDEPFLVCNGDIVTDIDITEMTERHRKGAAELSIALHEVEDPSRFGVVALDAKHRITRFVEKPPTGEAPSNLINAGIWLFEPDLLEEMDATSFNRVEEGLFPSLAESGRAIAGFVSDSYWIDVGNAEAYLQVNLDLLGGAMAGYEPLGRLVDSTASVASSAQLEAVVVGPGSIIGERVSVAGSVLWDDVTIAAGAHVANSVVASGAWVGSGATLEGAIVAHGARVEAGAHPAPGARIEAATVAANEASGR